MHPIQHLAVALACVAAATAPGRSQDPAPPPAGPSTVELQERLAAKIGKSVFAKHTWHGTRAAALEDARDRSTMVLAYFTRSYARCPPCESLEDRVLASDEFATVAERLALYLHVTSRVPEAVDAGLPDKLGFRAVPTIAVLAADGVMLHRVAYADLLDRPERVVARMLEIVDSLEERTRLTASLADELAEAGDPRTLRLLFADLRLGGMDPGVAANRVHALRSFATPAEQAKLETLLVDVEVETLLARAATIGRAKLNEALAGMAKSERLPSDRLAPRFWFEILRSARSDRDVVLFTQGVEDLRRRFGEDPGFAASLKLYEEQMADLERGVEKRR